MSERDEPRRRCECEEYAFVWVQGEYGLGWERERNGGSVLPRWCPAWCENCGTQLRADGTCLTREEQAREWAVGHGWSPPTCDLCSAEVANGEVLCPDCMALTADDAYRCDGCGSPAWEPCPCCDCEPGHCTCEEASE